MTKLTLMSLAEAELESRVICPECKAEGKKSTVYPYGATSTGMFCQPFYDEEGRYHFHDLNTHSENFRCSNGHHWRRTRPNRCWCGWEQEVH